MATTTAINELKSPTLDIIELSSAESQLADLQNELETLQDDFHEQSLFLFEADLDDYTKEEVKDFQKDIETARKALRAWEKQHGKELRELQELVAAVNKHNSLKVDILLVPNKSMAAFAKNYMAEESFNDEEHREWLYAGVNWAKVVTAMKQSFQRVKFRGTIYYFEGS